MKRARKAHSNTSPVQKASQNVMELDESGKSFPKMGEFIRQHGAFQLEANRFIRGERKYAENRRN